MEAKLNNSKDGNAITEIYSIKEWVQLRKTEPGAQSAFRALFEAQQRAYEMVRDAQAAQEQEAAE